MKALIGTEKRIRNGWLTMPLCRHGQPRASGMVFAFREPVHTAARDGVRVRASHKRRLRRMFEAQIALTIGLIAGLILGWLTAGMQ